jgi:hypothetical protein
MALKLRPTGLYSAVSGRSAAYTSAAASPKLSDGCGRSTAMLTRPPSIHTDGHAPTFEAAKAEFAARKRWLEWAKLDGRKVERPPTEATYHLSRITVPRITAMVRWFSPARWKRGSWPTKTATLRLRPGSRKLPMNMSGWRDGPRNAWEPPPPIRCSLSRRDWLNHCTAGARPGRTIKRGSKDREITLAK